MSVSVACMRRENVSLSVSVTCLHFQIFMHVCVCSVSADKAQTTMSVSQIVCVCLTLERCTAVFNESLGSQILHLFKKSDDSQTGPTTLNAFDGTESLSLIFVT